MSETLSFSCTICFVCDICEHTLCFDTVTRSAGRGTAIKEGWAIHPKILCPICKNRMDAVI